ncbi:TPA: phosphate starvation-inducible protein PhoH [candidate division WOR-3 bacterium]|jgi:phosphate starvation-inducible PhoH-like protein|uniref:PhoH-like protein n=1 Tax=candidate division WOR-3 bacterium TaxID=2052148 RepID=A0A350H8S9_UNCW3|nr:phosphate starvation-inducible protein PhoH [candidate division WOR-3 bacterium]
MIHLGGITSDFFDRFPNFKELIITNIKGSISEDEGLLYFDGRQEDFDKLNLIVAKLIEMESDKGYIERSDVIHLISKLLNEEARGKDANVYYLPKKILKPRTEGQERYVEALNSSDIAISIGPAGTGKTFIAVAKALSELLKKNVSRIILTRPAVEAGERLGFLPGDFKEKIDPYLRPLYDALYDLADKERIDKLIRDGIIEIAPLAYMRGRTLSNAYLILDEAQNTTSMQMKMFLTRLGMRSKAIITGDVTQIDLSITAKSGLVELEQIVKQIEGISFVYLGSEDVVRHALVKEIINAYSDFSKR